MSSTQEKTAILLGATGLVGSHILEQLLEDERYRRVKVFHRRKIGMEHPKLIEYVINFNEIRIWKHLITGDELYSALGTTLKKAGSKNAQLTVDYDHQFNVAEQARKNGVPSYALVSSLGASKHSSNFYLGMKGRLDAEVQKLGFNKVLIIRPSILKGERDEERTLEKLGAKFMEFATLLPGLGKYKPIHGETVARAMINGMNDPYSKTIYEGKEVFALSKADQ